MECKDCKITKEIIFFEKNRKVCKDCRKQSRKNRENELKIKNLQSNIINEPCKICNKKFDSKLFSLRTNGLYRKNCKECYNKKEYYKKQRN